MFASKAEQKRALTKANSLWYNNLSETDLPFDVHQYRAERDDKIINTLTPEKAANLRKAIADYAEAKATPIMEKPKRGENEAGSDGYTPRQKDMLAKIHWGCYQKAFQLAEEKYGPLTKDNKWPHNWWMGKATMMDVNDKFNKEGADLVAFLNTRQHRIDAWKPEVFYVVIWDRNKGKQVGIKHLI